MNEQTDQELVRGCLRGDEACFGQLLGRYEKPVYNLAFRFAGTKDDAEDITQAAFVKVYENLASYDPRRKFFSWMYRIALNEALNFKRAQKGASDLPEDVPVEEETIHEKLENQEEQQQIEQALFGLSPDLRSVIVLHYFADCSYADISFILDIPERTVKSRLYEARDRLRRLLNTSRRP